MKECEDTDSLLYQIELLCGQKPSPSDYIKEKVEKDGFPATGMGWGQLNELLLALQLDRATDGFFKYVFRSRHIVSMEAFKNRIHNYRIRAIIKYGNFKFAYKTLSKMTEAGIQSELALCEPVDVAIFKDRHPPLVELRPIPPEKTPLLGYLAEKDSEETRRIRADGVYNCECYLDYDHMDVYVATSMREPVDFWNVSRFINELFATPELEDLKLRYFDPTQAYSENRIDKGLVEGLMLKRARCTVYMAGEMETLGKDSELATTLAQGKPVIAYVPQLRDYNEFKDDYVESLLENIYPGSDRYEVAQKFLKMYCPDCAWRIPGIRDWLAGGPPPAFEELLHMIFDEAKAMYDKKARVLREVHPLGLQVNLGTGVANGVLVARNKDECARLVRGVLLNDLEFEFEDSPDGKGLVCLLEKTTGSVFRVSTKDTHVINSFWNFYLQ
jgi:hypothetical protein